MEGQCFLSLITNQTLGIKCFARWHEVLLPRDEVLKSIFHDRLESFLFAHILCFFFPLSHTFWIHLIHYIPLLDPVINELFWKYVMLWFSACVCMFPRTVLILAVNPEGTLVFKCFSSPFTVMVAVRVFALHVGHCVFVSVHVFIEKLWWCWWENIPPHVSHLQLNAAV